MIILTVAIVVRLPILDVPFERDEGEFAYVGNLILSDVTPYSFEGNLKLPGAYYYFALMIFIFGSSVSGIHMGLIIANFISACFIYLIAKKAYEDSRMYTILAAVLYLIMATHHAVLGFAMHATQVLAPFLVGSVFFLICFFDKKKYVWLIISGVLFSAAIIVKQPALLAGIIYLPLIGKDFTKSFKRVSSLAIGVAIPFIVILIPIFLSGAFDNFVRWIFVYAPQYAATEQDGNSWWDFLQKCYNSIGVFWPVWLTALLGTTLMSETFRKYDVLIFFMIGSLLCMVPGFFFRPHYFVFALPAISITSIYVLYSIDFASKRFSLILVVLFLAIGSKSIFYNYSHSNFEIMRFAYGIDPFYESPQISDFIKQNTSEDDRLFIFGNEPQLYFYSDRRSASEFIYTYPLVENQSLNVEMQQRMISQVDSLKPKMIIVTHEESWQVNEHTPMLMFDWIDSLVNTNYQEIGMMENYMQAHATFSWDPSSQNTAKPSPDAILRFYIRKPD